MSEPTTGGGLSATALAYAKLSPLWSKRSRRREATSQADAEPYTLMGEISHAVVMDADAQWVPRLFDFSEVASTSSDGEVIECVALGFFENLQNVASHADSATTAEKFVPMLGPTSRRLWDGVNGLWLAVAADPPKSGTPDEYRHVENAELRKIMQQMYRRLADGRYVSMATVLRWEAEHGRGPHLNQLRRKK